MASFIAKHVQDRTGKTTFIIIIVIIIILLLLFLAHQHKACRRNGISFGCQCVLYVIIIIIINFILMLIKMISPTAWWCQVSTSLSLKSTFMIVETWWGRCEIQWGVDCQRRRYINFRTVKQFFSRTSASWEWMSDKPPKAFYLCNCSIWHLRAMSWADPLITGAPSSHILFVDLHEVAENWRFRDGCFAICHYFTFAKIKLEATFCNVVANGIDCWKVACQSDVVRLHKILVISMGLLVMRLPLIWVDLHISKSVRTKLLGPDGKFILLIQLV